MASKVVKKKQVIAKESSERTNMFAWIFIVLGLLFFADNTIDIDFGTIWPLLLVALGVRMIWK